MPFHKNNKTQSKDVDEIYMSMQKYCASFFFFSASSLQVDCVFESTHLQFGWIDFKLVYKDPLNAKNSM